MKKLILYLSIISSVVVFSTACTETAPTDSDATAPSGYIMRDATDSRVTSSSIGVLAGHAGLDPSHVRGARIYDDFSRELTAAIVPGPNPLLGIATPPASPAVIDAEGWRCSSCHGFDYEGGVYTFNNGATNNLLELQGVRNRNEDFAIDMLMNGFDMYDGATATVVNVHNYTNILTPQAMVDVSDFVVNEIFDTHEFIRAPSSGGLGDHAEGMIFYSSVVDPVVSMIPPVIRVDGSNYNCESCHGLDGRLVPNIDLFQLAWEQPFKWLHRVNFGSPRDIAIFTDITAEDTSVHPGLYEVVLTDGLHFGGPQQAADLMAHVQKNFVPAP